MCLCITACALVEDDLRGEKTVLLALQVPPIPGQLLTRRLQPDAGGARNDVARYRAFDVDTHGVHFFYSLPVPAGPREPPCPTGSPARFHPAPGIEAGQLPSRSVRGQSSGPTFWAVRDFGGRQTAVPRC